MTEVLLFARARELAGTRRDHLPGTTVAEVLAVAGERYGADFAELAATCTVVVDGATVPRGEFATADAGAELAILPPVSGGSHDVDGDASSMRVAVLTVSDRASSGEYEDRTGPEIERLVTERWQARVVERALVPDEADVISEVLRRWCDEDVCDLVLTNGGTGLAPRDVTPEATRAVLDVEAPGLGELMRSVGSATTPLAALSRQAAGRRGATVVVNLPGSARGAVESLDALVDVLPHAVETARSGR